MKRKIMCLATLFSLVACENLMDEIPRSEESEKTAEFYQELSQTAALLSRLPLGHEQMNEVLDAVRGHMASRDRVPLTSGHSDLLSVSSSFTRALLESLTTGPVASAPLGSHHE